MAVVLAWERREGESEKAYRAFSLYRDMGSERSHRAVAEALYGVQAKYSIRTVHEWSRKFDWLDRVRALEARDEMLRREAIEQHQDAQAESHGRREAALRERALGVREAAMDQAEKMVSWPLSDQRVITTNDAGDEVTYVFMPAKWSKSTAVQLYHLAVGDAKLPAPEDLYEPDLGDLTDEELAEFIRLESKIRMTQKKPSEEG